MQVKPKVKESSSAMSLEHAAQHESAKYLNKKWENLRQTDTPICQRLMKSNP